ncbi:MAG: SurA N-terminal domain-containing protein [Nitrospirota bacterium]|nr:MAG: SurA N-terminal domain-containing protein [Nitrospirota bacterium]
MPVLLYVAIFTALIMSGCAKPAAEVNGEAISKKRFERVLNDRSSQHTMPDAKVDTSKLKDAVIQQLIGEKLLLQAARDNNIVVTDDDLNGKFDDIVKMFGEDRFKAQLSERDMTLDEYKQELRERMTIDMYMENLVPGDSIDEKDIKEFYKNSPRPFIMNERVNVRLIQLQDKAKAESIISEIVDAGKAGFDKVADRVKEQKRATVTDYGWVNPDFFSGEIQKALKELKTGGYGGPFASKDSFYLLRVKDREKERPKTFEEAKDEIRALILNEKRQGMYVHLIEERKKKADIKIHVK